VEPVGAGGQDLIPRVSIVLPAYEEGVAIERVLDQIFDSVRLTCEVLVVYDSPDDTTVPYLEKYAARDSRLTPILNTLGAGPAYAIRVGVAKASAPVVVVMMADGSDDPQQIEQLARLVERGVAVAAASRYTRGGQQVGGPFLKKILSRSAGLALYWLARVGTRDATNSFKAYSTTFLRDVGIASSSGFELGIELVAKARRLRLPIAEVPTIWLDRTTGASRFRMYQWIPRYLHWFRFAFGPKLSVDQVRTVR
jgi:dolichol-phosphate mannosyltransferase